MSATTSTPQNEGMEMTTVPNNTQKQSLQKSNQDENVYNIHTPAENDNKLSTYQKIVYVALFNAICAFLIILVVIILVMKSDNVGVRSNITTGGSFAITSIEERIIIINNIVNHHTTTNVSMKPNYIHIFDEPDIGPFEAFDFYHNDTEPTTIPTNYPTTKPTASPTDCSSGLNRLIDTTTLNGWTVRQTFEEPGKQVEAISGDAECIGINPCIWIRGTSGGAVAYNNIWVERILNTSVVHGIDIMIKAATTSMDVVGEYGFIETVCIAENGNYSNRTIFNDGHTGNRIAYIGCISVNTITCHSLILRIGGYISGVGDLVYISEVRTFPPVNDWNYTNMEIESTLNINKTISVMSEIFYPGGLWYGWTYMWWCTYGYAFSQGQTPGGWQVNLPLEIHAKYGDKLVFRKRLDWGDDNLLLVTKEMYETCNFSSITNWNSAVDKASAADYWLTDKYGLYDYPYGNSSDWKPFVFEIIDRSKYGINSIKDELLAANTLYFASSTRWNSGTWPSCKNGLKLKVIIEGYRENTLTVLNSNINAVVDSDEIRDLEASIGYLSRTALLAQFSDEQRIRSSGDSGLTNVRGYYDGERAYDDGTYSNGAVASIHDHTDNIRIVGIGEISAVLNGVEFQTRHNDYNLNMASTTSSDYHAIEAVPYPDIPSEILGANNINSQIDEMIEYFRAFKDQNKSHRNYTSYFRPILCYVEGAWILSNDNLLEPFSSDRHQLDASTWKQLHDKIRWMMNSGRKEPAENLAHLPSAIRNLYNNTYPIISNWEYRILCHPLKNDVTTRRFKISNDLHIQLQGSPETRNELYYSRRARFELNKWVDKNNYDNDDGIKTAWWNEGRKTWNYLDYLMEQIPGKDNYLANLTDELPDGTARVIHFNDAQDINSGYYSRYYGLTDNDAMGSTKHRRSWSDRYLFAAKTSHSVVSPISFDYEVTATTPHTFVSTESRWSYAIPLEIIYLTPLTSWNPYNITFYSDHNEWSHINTGRQGSCEPGDEYIGWSIYNAYFTPIELFENKLGDEAAGADTVKDGICVIDAHGIAHNVKASGHWITFPSIAKNVGKIRQRYPIFPIHYGGSVAYKETKALQDMILDKNNYDNIETGEKFWTENRDLLYGFVLYLSGGSHEHEVYIPGWRINYYWYDSVNEKYKNGSNYIITQDSNIANQHQHTVQIYRYKLTNNNNEWNYKMIKCRYGTLSDTKEMYPYQNTTCQDYHDELIRDTGDL